MSMDHFFNPSQLISSPLQDEVTNFTRNLNKMMGSFFEPTREVANVFGTHDEWMPKCDFVEHSDRYTLTAELPGFKKENISLSLDNGFLTVRGKYAEETSSNDSLIDGASRYHVQERHVGHFVRRFSIPQDASTKVEARHTNGVLTVNLPKVSSVTSSAQIPIL